MTPLFSEPDDQSLMQALQRGDDLALNGLMARWEKPLRSFLFRWTRNETDASDIAQEAFVRVYQNRRKFLRGAKFSTWLFQIALNLARDQARRAKRRPTQALELVAEPIEETNPNTAMLAAEKSAAVQAAIGDLPEDLKTAVLLFEYGEKSHAEISAITGATAKAVETRLYRARAQLRQALRKFLTDESPAERET